MFVELLLLQNFAPSCLNRDDTNSPKDCEFGGYRRARISSQCIKRAIRTYFKEHLLLPQACLATRTKKLAKEVSDRLIAAGRDAVLAPRVVEAALKGAGLHLTEGKTEYLLFVGEGEINALEAQCQKYWDALVHAAEPG